MDFALDEQTAILKETAQRFFRERFPSSRLRDVLASEEGYPPDLWREMAALGWLGLVCGEGYGGCGGSLLDLFVLVEEMGKVRLPGPFFCSSVLAGLLIEEAGDQRLKESLLPPMIRGEKIMTVALLDEKGRYDFDRPTLAARRLDGMTHELEGTRLLVPFAHVSEGILLCASTGEGADPVPTLFLVDPRAEGLRLFPLDTLTGEKAFALEFDRARVAADCTVGSIGQGNAHLRRLWPKAAVLKCAEMLGGIERVLEMTVTHVKERRQFDRPLGAFQAVQHACAEMATLRETTRLVTYQAAWLLSQGLPCEKEVALAKAWCNDASKRCMSIGHQLHGAIGFTEEHDMHFYSKHAKASEMAFGTSRLHRSCVADELGI